MSPMPATPTTSEEKTSGTTIISSRSQEQLADRLRDVFNDPDHARMVAAKALG